MGRTFLTHNVNCSQMLISRFLQGGTDHSKATIRAKAMGYLTMLMVIFVSALASYGTYVSQADISQTDTQEGPFTKFLYI